MLQDCDKDPDGMGSIVSWISEGKAFRVHKRKVFVETILPSYFNQTKYKSFQRQLNLWGFDRIVKSGSEKGAYYHMHFLRDQPLVIQKMRRIRAIQKMPAKERRRRQALFQQEAPSEKKQQDPITLSEDDNVVVSSSSDGGSSICSIRDDHDDDDDDKRGGTTDHLLPLQESWSFSRVLDSDHSLPDQIPHPIYTPATLSTASENCTTVVTTCSSPATFTEEPSDKDYHDDSKEEPDNHGSRGVDSLVCGKDLDTIFLKSDFFSPSSNNHEMFMEEQDDVSFLSASSSLSLLDEFIPLFPIISEDD